MEPQPVSIHELSQHVSRYVALARKGQRIPVTDRGELVAYLVPARESGTTLDQLAAAGALRPAVGGIADLLTPQPGRPRRNPLTEAPAGP